MSTPKIAGAPISWGVCEVPGWGHQLSAERVLREMSIAGLTATELGPKGYLPTEPARLTSLLESVVACRSAGRAVFAREPN